MIPTKNWARLAGLLYLLVIALGLFAEVFVREALTVSNDAVATLNNIRTSEMRFRLGFAADLVNLICGLINSFTGFLMPEFRNPLFPVILLPSFIGELSVALWLLIKGVKATN
jgi:hypothetical protein